MSRRSLLFMVLLLLSGCGQKGNLYLPQQTPSKRRQERG